MVEFPALLEALAAERPVFHSEADFQFALAWQVRETTGQPVRLEWKPFAAEKIHVDLFLPRAGAAVELKYLTRGFEANCNGESFSLADQAAHDIRRYDFLKDVARLERVTAEHGRVKRGIAILLTNDAAHWSPPTRRNTVDADFRIHEGRTASGPLTWATHAGRGTTRGREDPILLEGSYRFRWRDYGNPVQQRHGQFRYLAVEVSKGRNRESPSRRPAAGRTVGS